MKLRHRSVIKEKYDGLDISEVSSEVDSDESDNWGASKSRKNRPKKRKRMISPALSSSKKKRASEEVENVYQFFVCNLMCIPPTCHILLFHLFPN
jgi:hypothetical protein